MNEGVRSLLLDVEGTTTPIDFVYKVLFPYARSRVAAFVAEHGGEIAGDLELLRREHAVDSARGSRPPDWSETPASVAGYVSWLMDRDRKSTGLKSLQGRIWQLGYGRGELRGEVYPDVPRAFRRWRDQGRDISIFSSGSVLAQQLLFGRSTEGDLRPYLRAYFDTTIGPKKESASYERIASELGRTPGSVLFISDVAAELDAAREAGLEITLCVRTGAVAGEYPRISTFDEVFS